MANASLNIPITGDASALIAEVNRAAAELKKIQEQFNNAFTTKGKKLKVEIDETLIEGSIADLKQKIKSLEETRGKLAPFDIANIEAANRQIEEYKNEIKRLQGIGIKIDIEPPPNGSIADIKRTIQEITQKRDIQSPWDTGAIEQYNRMINVLKERLKELQSRGISVDVEPISPVLENSIAGLQEKLNKLRNAQINIDVLNEKEIAQTNDEIKRLEAEIQRLKGLSIDPNGKLTQSSAKARQAITSLSLVAQDLPFGFIAIQNNLPAVLQTFSELKTESKGSGGALKELGKVLVGPAGVFLAFSAVTAAVTYAIKEYGSLTNAIDVLIGANGSAVQAQVAFNKALQDESKNIGGSIEQIKILVKNYQDENATQAERLAAYRALKEINPDIVAGIDEQNLSTATSIQLLGENAAAVINLIRVQTTQRAIQKVLDDLEGKRLIANGKLLKAKEEELDLKNKIANIDRKNKQGEGLTLEEIQIEDDKVVLLGLYGEKVKDARAEVLELNGVQQKWLKQFEPLVNQTSKASSALETLKENLKKLREEQNKKTGDKPKTFTPTIDSQALDEAFNLDTIISNLTKYGNALIDVNNSEKERKNALRELLEINPEYFASFDLNKRRVDELKTSIEAFIRTLLVEKKAREDAAAASKINEKFRQNEEKGIERLGDKYSILNDEKYKTTLPTTIEQAVKLEPIFSTTDLKKYLNNAFAGLDIEQSLDGYISKFKDLKDVYADTFPDLVKKNKEIADSINSYLTQPLTDVFDILLKDGEKSWKDFGNTVIDTLKRIAVQLIATAIAKTIANILAPGSGTLTEAAFEEYFQQFGGTIRGGGKQANFGRIRGERSMAMSGQVNMVLRGSDLVGAMNRTNSTISRVG